MRNDSILVPIDIGKLFMSLASEREERSGSATTQGRSSERQRLRAVKRAIDQVVASDVVGISKQKFSFRQIEFACPADALELPAEVLNRKRRSSVASVSSGNDGFAEDEYFRLGEDSLDSPEEESAENKIKSGSDAAEREDLQNIWSALRIGAANS